MKVNNNGVVYIKALDGSILRLEEVEGYYNIGHDILVIQFKDGGERYFTNYTMLLN